MQGTGQRRPLMRPADIPRAGFPDQDFCNEKPTILFVAPGPSAEIAPSTRLRRQARCFREAIDEIGRATEGVRSPAAAPRACSGTVAHAPSIWRSAEFCLRVATSELLYAAPQVS